MAKKLTISETRPYSDVPWYFQHLENEGKAPTAEERAAEYNIDMSSWPSEIHEEDQITIASFSSRIDGPTYKMEIIYADNDPIKFFAEECESYKARLKYCEDNKIIVTSSLADIEDPVPTPPEE
jgi:hypothetical protein